MGSKSVIEKGFFMKLNSTKLKLSFIFTEFNSMKL